jgi:hypothetical protein
MADTTTANIALLIADLNDVFNFGAHVENNFTTIDTLFGAVDCTSTSRPSNTFKGQIVYEHDSLRYVQNTGTKASPVWTYMSHAALSVLAASLPTSGVTNGTLAYATDANALLVADGGTFRYKTNLAVASSARPTAVEAGATIYETDTGRSMVYTGSTWVPMGRCIMAAPTTTSTNGTAGSTTTGTEVFDAVLGYHQATLVSGRRYEVTVNGLIGNSGASGDEYTLQIRDSQSASNPTSASALVTQSEWTAPGAGSAGRNGIPLSQTFLCTVTGVHKFGVSYTKVSGTGPLTPLGTRELFIEDVGAAY